MKVSFIRHGESKYNKNGLLQGRIDCDLSDYGIDQTNKIKTVINSNDYDICFSSPLKRATKTAEILFPNLEIILDDRLIERDLGKLENTEITDEKLFMLKQNNFAGVESIEEMQKRIKDFLEYLKNNYSNKKVIVVTHAGVIYTVQRILGLNIKPINNLEIVSVDID